MCHQMPAAPCDVNLYTWGKSGDIREWQKRNIWNNCQFASEIAAYDKWNEYIDMKIRYESLLNESLFWGCDIK